MCLTSLRNISKHWKTWYLLGVNIFPSFFLREELLQAGVPKYPYPDYLTRTDMELRRIINAQVRLGIEMYICINAAKNW